MFNVHSQHWGPRGNKIHCFPWGQSLVLNKFYTFLPTCLQLMNFQSSSVNGSLEGSCWLIHKDLFFGSSWQERSMTSPNLQWRHECFKARPTDFSFLFITLMIDHCIDAKQILKSISKIQEFPSEEVRISTNLFSQWHVVWNDMFSVCCPDYMYTLSCNHFIPAMLAEVGSGRNNI